MWPLHLNSTKKSPGGPCKTPQKRLQRPPKTTSENPRGRLVRGALWSDFVGVTKWPLELVGWGLFFVPAGGRNRCWGGFGAKFGRTFGRKPGSKVVCAAISGGLCAMPECPSSQAKAQRQKSQCAAKFAQPCAQCPRRPSSLICVQSWLFVLQRPPGSLHSMPEGPERSECSTPQAKAKCRKVDAPTA